ncbi:hypothetical protein Rhopal_002909-T1 [Rhodotorula paludigena]|uniref:Uncharacterized protein n=1 Tax=Rhodotorula paludigena TaxID=86838 RepID=A0AAV5GJA7_9BASI|nr:hypothetical protein Rhopal_002909-T1 [Rhodotorula paludigena]
MEGIDDFFQTLDVELAGWDNALDPAVPYPLPGFESPAAGPSTAGHVVDGGGIALEDTEGYMDPTYNVLNDSYLCALAKPLRDLIVQSASRAVVSSELNRNAAMAVCMIYRMRAQQQVHAEAAVRPDNDAEEECLRKKSDGYFHRAIDNLQSQPIPLGAKMLAFLDLHEHQFFQVGAAASTVLRRLGDTFVEELGPRPLLDVVKLDSYDRVLLSMYAWSDCVRTITVPKKRTLFAFTRLPGEPSVDSPGTLVDSVTDFVSPLPSLVGLPVGLMLCFAATSNLSAEMDALPDEVVKAKATAIEKAIRAWHLPTPTAHELADSAYYMETLTNSEMWRHAAIIYLYQAVYLHGPLSKVILASLQQILQLGARSLVQYEQSTSRLAPGSDSPAALATPPTTTTPSVTSPAAPPPTSETMDRFFSPVHRAVPFFLAGTCALLPSEREVCLRGLRACGPAKGWSDDVAALERVWEVQGEKGWLRDWRTVLEEEKLHIAFL